MADVRLTATNPADSSVVPVACNEKGELKLEEIPDQSFDGNLEGDLTVSGSATFAGNLFVGDDANISSTDGSANFAGNNIQLFADGSAEFAGDAFSIGGGATAGFFKADRTFSGQANPDSLQFNVSTGEMIRGVLNGGTSVFSINRDGSVTFAADKAGFTAQGHLWCTTPRGDTVMLTATVGGAGMWEEYNPPSSRRDEIKERWSEKNATRPMPEESSQDEPETPQ